MVQPLTSEIVLHRACKANGLDKTDDCQENVPGYDDAQRDAASFMSTWAILCLLPDFGTCALYGCLGDAYGRRLTLISSCFGMACASLAWGLVPTSHEWDVLLVGLFVSSLFGGQFVQNQSAMAAVADVTRDASAEQRAKIFGFVIAALYAGCSIGPVLGGIMGDSLGYQNSFLACACIGISNLLITVLTFRETLEEDRRLSINWWRANPFVALTMLGETRITMLLGIVLFVGIFNSSGVITVLGLYMIKTTNMQAFMLGLIGSATAWASSLGLIFIMPLLTYCLRLHHILVLSALIDMLSSLVLSVCSTELHFLIVCSLSGITAAFIFPILRTGIVNTFGSCRYGESFAAVACTQQLAGALGKAITPCIYRATENTVAHIGPVTMRCIALGFSALCGLLGTTAAALVPSVPEEVDSQVFSAIPMGSTELASAADKNPRGATAVK